MGQIENLVRERRGEYTIEYGTKMIKFWIFHKILSAFSALNSHKDITLKSHSIISSILITFTWYAWLLLTDYESRDWKKRQDLTSRGDNLTCDNDPDFQLSGYESGLKQSSLPELNFAGWAFFQFLAPDNFSTWYSADSPSKLDAWVKLDPCRHQNKKNNRFGFGSITLVSLGT